MHKELSELNSQNISNPIRKHNILYREDINVANSIWKGIQHH